MPHREAAIGPASPRAPLFLHRATYRRRRVMDAARLLPIFGAALLLLPMLWERSHATGAGMVYLFLAWAGLIATAAILSARLSEPLRRGAPEGQSDAAGEDER